MKDTYCRLEIFHGFLVENKENKSKESSMFLQNEYAYVEKYLDITSLKGRNINRN